MKTFTGKIGRIVLQGCVKVVLSNETTLETAKFRITSEKSVQMSHGGETLTLSSPPSVSFSSTGISVIGASVSMINGEIFINGKHFDSKSLINDKKEEE